jgi:predicted DNA-binding transcriptional regulator YafY
VEVLADAPAAAVRERIGHWSTVEEAQDGRTLIRMTADSLEWPAAALAMLDADFRVVSPPELLDRLHTVAARFSRA